MFSAAALAIFFFLAGVSKNKKVHSEMFAVASGEAEKSRVTRPFSLTGHTSNVKIRIATDLHNAWTYFGMALVNTQTNEAIDFGKEVSYYQGRDSDGAWSEGKTWGSIYVPSVASGEYYLRLEPETNAAVVRYTVSIYRDVPRVAYLMWTLLLLIVPALYTELCHRSFEMKRWAESDHPWVQTEED